MAWMFGEPLFRDRFDAGRRLAGELREQWSPETVVVGLARGGVQVASEVARALASPLDVVAVRKIGHPLQPEYAIGAVAPGDAVYVRGPDGLTEAEVAEAVESARARAEELDRRLHAAHPPLDLGGKTVLLVDDGLATGATMIAAARWARRHGAGRVVAAVPVAASSSVELLREEIDELVCPHILDALGAVGLWYGDFPQAGDKEVLRLLDESTAPELSTPPAAGSV
jgi:putative phosphoribosyl transferase